MSADIAIIGMAGRFPKARDIDELWFNLLAGRTAFEEVSDSELRKAGVSEEQWKDPDYVRVCAPLDDFDCFDANFFGFSPREARAMDPQQRVALEVAWETFENAGVVPSDFPGAIGVFGGAGGVVASYFGAAGGNLGVLAGDTASLEHIGNDKDFLATRISYKLGLRGPSMTIQSACSTSLVAIHVACQSLLFGECDMALAGGVTIRVPHRIGYLHKNEGIFSPDGRCRPFDASAAGTVFGSGAGFVLLRRLDKAIAEGNRILAVIRGSAVNNDGNAKVSYTASGLEGQVSVVSEALAIAQVDPRTIGFIETHGTGTLVGDPIEFGALKRVLGEGGKRFPCVLGAIKANIGHLEAAAGVAGLIKAVQAVRSGLIPPQPGFGKPNPKLQLETTRFRIPTDVASFHARVRRAGVTALGVGGTNAHVILEEPPKEAAGERAAGGGLSLVPLLLSGKSIEALLEQGSRLAAYMREHAEVDAVDVGYTLATGRTHFEERAALLWKEAEGRERLLERLTGLVEGAGGEKGGWLGSARERGKLCVLFTGQGSQRAGMGQELYGRNETFRKALDAVFVEMDKHLLGRGRRGLKEVMFAEEGSEAGEQLHRTEYAQSALFALEVGLYRVVESLGVKAEVLLGHSIGELVAAHVSGVLGLVEACRLVSERGRLMQALEEGGAMVSVEATEAQVLSALALAGGRASVAGVNGPKSVVVSGEEAAVVRAVAELERRGHRATRLKVSHAFHSELMEPMLEEFGRVAGGLVYGERRVGVVSNLSGRRAEGEEQRSAEYWVRHARGAVRFYEGVKSLHAEGVRTYLELGPGAVLSGLGAQSVEGEAGGEGSEFIASMRKGKGEEEGLLEALCRLHVLGQGVDWSAFFKAYGARKVQLPTYAFQRQRYWLEERQFQAGRGGLAVAGLASEHAWLDAATELADSGRLLFAGRLSLEEMPWLSGHKVFGSVVLPGTAFVDMALALLKPVDADVLEELTIEEPIVLNERQPLKLQVQVEPENGESRRGISFYSQKEESHEGAAWTKHARGWLGKKREERMEALGEWPPSGAQEMRMEGAYEELAAVGFGYSGAFQGLKRVWEEEEILWVEAEVPTLEGVEGGKFVLHPALLDSVLHAGALQGIRGGGGEEGLRLPFAWEGVSLYSRGASSVRARLSVRADSWKVELWDGAGQAVAVVEALSLRKATAEQIGKAPGMSGRLYEVQWKEGKGEFAGTGFLEGDSWVAVGSDAFGLGAQSSLGQSQGSFETLGALRAALAGGMEAPKWLVVQWGAGEELSLARVREGLGKGLELAQGWLSEEKLRRSGMVWITRGAVWARQGDAVEGLAHAGLWGLGRTVQVEETERRLILVDMDASEASSKGLLGALGSGEGQLALREGHPLVPRVRRASKPGGQAFEALSGEGTVLLTGATGGLGALLARHLQRVHGVKHLLLVSRHGLAAPGAMELKAELERGGASVRLESCDVAKKEQLRTLLSSIAPEHPLEAVFHVAGVSEDALLQNQTPEKLERVLASKADGALNLHELTQDRKLHSFVMFSSMSGILGNEGQANYGAANALLDALAMYRRERGLAGMSMAWGPWGQVGLAAQMQEQEKARLLKKGLPFLASAEGLELMDAAWRLGKGIVLPVPIDVVALEGMGDALPAILKDLVRGRPQSSKAQGLEKGSGLQRKLSSASEAERQPMMEQMISGEVAAVLGLQKDGALSASRPLQELGLDSLMALEVRNRLSSLFEQRLPATLLFDYPTIQGLAQWLLRKLSFEGVKERKVTKEGRARKAEDTIAIVSMACRYPGGVMTPEQLWELLRDGVDATGELPARPGWELERLYGADPEAAGKSYTKRGGFLYEAAGFDAGFFGISPREAQHIDPQQRLLLETAWEALERGGIVPDSLLKSRTGVFVGIMYQDYGAQLFGTPEALDGYVGIGSAASVASGRISYSLGLEGPALTVDTACSSSLVALHLACQSLRNRECDLALAGGSTVMATPTTLIEFSRQRGLSEDGRCKAFSDNADGVGWAEGVGVLLLERLEDAKKNGHAVLALIRGSAVNQDGRSQGLTAPNGPSQENVILQALSNAGLRVEEVDAVEAHGTGTKLGDPIEAQALLATYGQRPRAGDPLYLGSIKSNLGHTQAAAGVAGVMKMVLAMQRGRLPRTLHAEPASRHVDWTAGHLKLLTEAVEWKRGGHPRRAGVSSFGISGTNAHVILEEGPSEETKERLAGGSVGFVPLLLSGKSREALREQCSRLAAYMREHAEAEVVDVGYTLGVCRTHFEERAALLWKEAEGRERLLERLTGLVEGAGGEKGGWLGSARERGKLCVLFTGQGSQRAGMGKELYGRNETFRKALDAVFGEMDKHLLGRGRLGLKEVMFAEEGSEAGEELNRTEYAQSALFALEVGLYRVVESLGVKVDVLLGHSIGELVAAHVSGVLGLVEACRLVSERGRLMQALEEGGAMVSVEATEAQVLSALALAGGRASVAGVNGPKSVVVSGEEAAVGRAVAELERRGHRATRLKVSHAFHSELMEPMLEEFGRVAGGLVYGERRVGVVSNLSGRRAEGEEQRSAEYWVRHARGAVRFYEGVKSLHAEGVRTYLELGPGAVLSALGAQSVEGEAGGEGSEFIASMRKGKGEEEGLLEALCRLHVLGQGVDWSAFFKAYGARKVQLPTYAFQRQPYWLDMPRRGWQGGTLLHPLLGVRLELAGEGASYANTLETTRLAYLKEHQVFGRAVVPGMGLLEMAFAAGQDLFRPAGAKLSVRGMVLERPLVLGDAGEVEVQLRARREEEGEEASFEIFSRAGEQGAWSLHASGRLKAGGPREPESLDVEELKRSCPEGLGMGEIYEEMLRSGLEYGPAFQGMVELWKGEGESLGRVRRPQSLEKGTEGYFIHPALLDAALHGIGALVPEGGAAGVYLPFGVDGFRVLKEEVGDEFWAYAKLRDSKEGVDGQLTVDVALAGLDGEVLARLEGLSLRRAKAELLGGEAEETLEELLLVDWEEQPGLGLAGLGKGAWLVVGEAGGLRGELAARLRGEGRLVEEHAWKDGGGWSGALEAVDGESGGLAGAVFLLDSAGQEANAGLGRRSSELTVECLELAKKLLRVAKEGETRILWVTRGTIGIEGGEARGWMLERAPLWGLGRVLRSEHPELGLKLVDLGAAAETKEAEAQMLLAELGSEGAREPEVALRGTRRLAPRLRSGVGVGRERLRLPAGPNYGLVIQEKGILENLRLEARPRREPGAEEVEIRIEAAGLVFRNVLQVLGELDSLQAELGMECAGTVESVGAGVTDLEPGARVMATVKAGGFGRFATVNRQFVSRSPSRLTSVEAATVPINFLTGWYGFFELAKLKAGERVLIHAAAGGVGLAAVQLAQWAGAEIFATASPSKWPILKEMGVKHLASSRDLSFAEQFRATTQGKGMDVVLNSLSGGFLEKSMELLVPGGRFLEMGKRGILEVEEASRRFPGIQYKPFDLSEVAGEKIQEIFARLLDLFEQGILKPVRHQVYPITRAVEAFRELAQGKTIGKLVLVPVVSLDGLEKAGTYLVTGGLGALGLQVADRLVEAGARRLMLLGRREPTDAARRRLAEMEARGAEVVVVRADVSDRDSLKKALDSIPADAPLRGIVHTAGVLDDGVVLEQTAERLMRVMGPKVQGAWNLHELTKDARGLDLFVVFSSISALLGNAGQAGYAAGNAFMDELVAYRRQRGLSGTSIAWGLWAGEGMGQGLDASALRRLEQGGFSALAPETGIELLEKILDSGVEYAVATRLSRARFAMASERGVPALFTHLVKASARKKEKRQQAGGLIEKLRALEGEERSALLGEALRGEVAQVLGLSSPDVVPLDKPLKMLGLDSLMAIELRNRVSKLLEQGMPATLAFDYPTLEKQVAFLLGKLELGKTESRPAAVKPKRREGEAIAVVGMGCRFPGDVKDPEGFWRLLRYGADVVQEVPSERWEVSAFYDADPTAVGKTYSKWGGFVSGVSQFDPLFFGISPREALSMDPQQRLLLETSWEALERANWVPGRLMGSRTGVYVGLSWSEYGARAASQGSADGYAGTGNWSSVAAGRISYTFGLQGPAVVVDTACSSSLVAVHLAAQALRNGECDVALAGGANLMLDPDAFLGLSRLQALSPTGRCHSFSEKADGYVRAEGCGMLVLKRLSEAQADGDRILGVIRGSAVNQDGRSQGLTAPNGPAQEEVIAAALRQAGLSGSEIDYVECHGTGTKLGDPIEVQALGAVLGKGRSPERPVRIGTVKSNMGHAEASSGMAGLIKVLLALRNEQIPASLHSLPPNPFVAWGELPLKVVRELEAWPKGESPRRAGVSSFGISGTNAHVIVEEAPEPKRVQKPGVAVPEYAAVLVSGKSAEALAGQAAELLGYLREHAEVGLLDVAFTLATKRTHFEERAGLVFRVAEGRAGLLAELEQYSEGRGSVEGGAREPGKLCVLFTGQGSQRAGMGQELYGRNETFRKALDAVFVEMDKHLLGRGRLGLKEVMFAEEGSEAGEQLHRTEYAQSALFALEVGLYRVVESLGVKVDVLLGHSIGELVAAHVSGVLGLVEACRLVSERGRLMQALEEGGAMVSVEATEAQVLSALALAGGRASVAGGNGPNSVVVSGEEAAVVRAVAELERRGHKATRLKVSHAFHSELMEPMLEEFGRVAGGLVYGERRVGVVSNLSGRRAEGEEQRSAEYWVRHARGAVRFYEGVKSLHAEGVRTYLELGPGAVLSALGAQSVEAEAGGEGSEFIASMRKGKGEEEGLLEALCRLHTRGLDVDWSAFFQPYGCKAVDLPTYAFQRQRYWLEAQPKAKDLARAQASSTAPALASQEEQLLTEWNVVALAQRLQKIAGLDSEVAARVAAALTKSRAQTNAEHFLEHNVYELAWREGSARMSLRQEPRGLWLLLGAPAGWAEALGELLRGHGASAQAVEFGEAFDVREGQAWRMDWGNPEHWQKLLAGAGRDCRGIVHCAALGMDGAFSYEASREAMLGMVHLLRGLGAKEGSAPAIRFLTRGAVAFGGQTLASLGQSLLWGLGKSIALEYPRYECRFIDLEPSLEVLVGAGLADALLGEGDEERIALRGGRQFVERLAPKRVEAGDEGFEARGAWLITGGLGALGLHVARWLKEKGASRLILVGRRGMQTPGAAEAVAELSRGGTKVQVVAGDVGAEQDFARVMQEARLEEQGLEGIVHAAGVGSMMRLAEATVAKVDSEIEGKVRGAWHLHEWTLRHPVARFLVFSSGAAAWGSAGQGVYGAGNAFLDALVLQRRRMGLPGLSLAWGVWSGGGMASDAPLEWMSKVGLKPMEPLVCMQVMERLLAQEAKQSNLVVAEVDWPTFRQTYEFARPRKLLLELPGLQSPQEVIQSSQASEWTERLRKENPAIRKPMMMDFVKEEVSKSLGFQDSKNIDVRKGFFNLGMDSLMAVEFAKRLEKLLIVSVKATTIFNHSNIERLSEFLLAQLGLSKDEADRPEPLAASLSPEVHEQDIVDLKSLSDDEAIALADSLFE